MLRRGLPAGTLVFALPISAILATAGYAQPQTFDFGTGELGDTSTLCIIACFGANCSGMGTVSTMAVDPPFFVRGIRVAPSGVEDNLCDNTPDVTDAASLPLELAAGERLVFDVDLVRTELGAANELLSINGVPSFDLMSFTDPAADCTGGNIIECLQSERFKVQILWRTGFGTRGPGQVVQTGVGSDDSGLFYFFDQDNWEVLLKVLNACGSEQIGRFWVFAAATTNVEYTITVVDTEVQEVKSYHKPLGPPAPAITDTNAFATCP